ncbi:MAG: DUF4983 domain-containing protein [Niabella sp.]
MLLIVAEGATSDAVKAIMPTNISKLLEKAKYSWNSYGDPNTTDAGAWVGLTAGKSSITYGTVDSTLSIPIEDGNEENHGGVTYIPNYSQRLLATGKVGVANSRMVVASSWQSLLDVTYKYADKKIFAVGDEQIKDSAILSLADPYLSHLVVDLNGANIAGKMYGFSPTVNQYRDAINKVDDYIGKIVTAVKSRSNYNAEDWLIIVTTTHGMQSDNISYGGSSIPERKIFTIFHNDNLIKQELKSPDLTNGLNNNGKANTISMDAATASPYDIPSTGGYTIMFKVRNITKSGSNTVLLSKATHAYSNPRGWAFMLVGTNKNYRLGIGDASGTGNVYKYFIGGASSEASAEVNVWDAIALRVYDSASTRYAVLYTNNKRSAASAIGNIVSAATTSSFIIGNISSSLGTSNSIISNLSIWNTALSEQEILNSVCDQVITSSHPKYANLIGYWPMDEGTGKVLKNYAPLALGKDFTFTDFGNKSWNLIDMPCASTVNTFQTSVMDIVPTIFYWLNAPVSDSWGLEGTAWLKDYETEFVSK